MEPEETPGTGLATVRRVPRYGVFMGLGAALAAVVAAILAFTGDGGPSIIGVEYSTSQVLGFALLYLVPIGVALGAGVAILLERLTRRSDRIVRVERERIRVAPEHPDAGGD